MERKKLLSNLENRNIEQIYLIYGKESFLIEEIQEKFKTLVDEAMMVRKQILKNLDLL